MSLRIVNHDLEKVPNDEVNRAGSIVSGIQAVRMRDNLIPLRFNDLFGVPSG
jgi:hypothetical protein